MSYFQEALSRNPQRLSIAERDEQEARKVAIDTGRYYTCSDGSVVVSKKFVDDYVDLCQKQ